MFSKMIIKIYEIRYSKYKRVIDRSLYEAKAYLFDKDQTQYKKCMKRVLKYTKKLNKLSERTNKILYG